MAQVIPGHEAWSGGEGEVGVLVLHGYTASPYAVRPLAQLIANAGYRVELPRLPGHGTHWKDLAKTTWRDWAREAIGAFEMLRSRTRAQVVVGLSVGGALALHLAETRNDIAGLVLVNPSVWSGDPRVKILPILKWVLPSVPGVANDIALEGQDEHAYERMPTRSSASLIEFQRMVREAFSEVSCPLLLLTSPQDHVVEPAGSDMIRDGVSSGDVEHVLLQRSYHVAWLDHDRPEIERRALEFIQRVTSSPVRP
jgi:carboxylesterase